MNIAPVYGPNGGSAIADRARFVAALESARPALERRAAQSLPAADAQDAVQDALIIALRKADWQQIENPHFWILGVLDYHIKNVLRRNVPLPIAEIFVGTEADTMQHVNDPCADALDALATNAERIAQVAAIRAAMRAADLKPKERDALVCRLTGKTNDEAAERLGMEPGTFRKYLSLAIAKIKPLLRGLPV